MAELDDELDDALIESIEFAGETVTLYGHTPGQVFEGSALVNGGEGEFESVMGGTYEKIAYTVTIPKASITFKPEPGMLAEVRAEELRIPSDGVRNRRRSYLVTLAGRDVPR